jgi:four helix bundle protein
MRRASVSIMSNIAEGFGRVGNRELIRFLDISRASVLEVQSLSYVALDVGHISRKEFERLYSAAEEVLGLVSGLAAYLRKSLAASGLERRTSKPALRTE